MFIVVIPTDEIVINWVDYLYESIHKTEIRNQVDLDVVAAELNIERDALDYVWNYLVLIVLVQHVKY